MASRVTQHVVEVLTRIPGAQARATQQTVEVLTRVSTREARVSQHVVEVLTHVPLPPLINRCELPFLEAPRFPDQIAYGAVGGPEFHTLVVESPAGAEYREQQWPLGPAVYDLSLVHRDETLTRMLLAFFRCVKGQAHGFRFHDFQPGESTGDHELLGYGDGTTTTFQLVKQYVIGGLAYKRTILKPVEGSVVAFVNDVPLDASQYSADSRNGVVTFTTPPPEDQTVRASFAFDVPVRFATDWLGIRRVAPRAYTWEGVILQEIRPNVP